MAVEAERKKILCLFDVDGTLTKPRQEITDDMQKFMAEEVGGAAGDREGVAGATGKGEERTGKEVAAEEKGAEEKGKEEKGSEKKRAEEKGGGEEALEQEQE